MILFARDLRDLLRRNQGRLLVIQLCALYQHQFGVPLKPQRYNYPSLATLLQAVDFVATVRGRGVRCTLILCQDFLGKFVIFHPDMNQYFSKNKLEGETF